MTSSSNNDNKNNSNIPQSDPSKAMDSKQEVNQSPDAKIDQDFSGYPHYPAKEDIMDESTGSHRVDASLEEMGTGPNTTGVSQRYADGQEGGRSEASLNKKEHAGNSNDALQGNNEEYGVPQNVTNKDLNEERDLPGTDVEEAAEKGSTNP